MRPVISLVLVALTTSACVSADDDGADNVVSPSDGKADGETPTLTIMQGHVPEKVSIECSMTKPDKDCEITFVLAPTTYTKKLIGKKLAGKTAADLPLAVVRENLQGEPFGTIELVADLRVDDGTHGAPVAVLADGTPVMFTGDQIHIVQRAQTASMLRLQMDVAFWYNAVDFEYTATFLETDAQTQMK